ncbi:hypothetical protein [Actinoplanes sp. NPDC020271]
MMPVLDAVADWSREHPMAYEVDGPSTVIPGGPL